MGDYAATDPATEILLIELPAGGPIERVEVACALPKNTTPTAVGAN